MIEDSLFQSAVRAERLREQEIERKQQKIINALEAYYDQLEAYQDNPKLFERIPTMYMVAKEHGLSEQQLVRLHKRLLKAIEEGELQSE